jgi:hypothetical protein
MPYSSKLLPQNAWVTVAPTFAALALPSEAARIEKPVVLGVSAI